MAAAYAALYPLPNRPGTVSNYFTNQLRPYDYNAGMGRVDHNFSSTPTVCSRPPTGTSARRIATTGRRTRPTPPTAASSTASPVTKGFDYRTNTGVTGGYTSTLSLESAARRARRAGRAFGEYRDPAQDFDPATLGFSPTALPLMSGYHYLPLFTFGTFSTTNESSTIASLGARRSDWGDGFNRPMDTLLGRADADARSGARTRRAPATTSGCRSGTSPTTASRADASSSTAPTRARTTPRRPTIARSRGRSSCSGCRPRRPARSRRRAPQSSQFEIASPGAFTQMYHRFFVQDDWRVIAEADAQPRAAARDQLRHDANRRTAIWPASTPIVVEPDRAARRAPTTR